MTTKFVNSVQSVFILCIVLFSVLACEKDFEDIGVTLIDNNLFKTKDSVFEVVAFSKDITSSRVDGLPQYLIGVNNDANFGLMNATFVSQLSFSGLVDFGLNPKIDKVILDIPYYATRQTESHENGSPKFELDSIIGDQEIEYTLKVHRLETFLNTLDPLNPAKNKKYYSNEDYTTVSGSELYEGVFKPNASDTVLYVERKFLDDDFNTVDDIDTIKKTDLLPSIKLPLDPDAVKTIFIDNAVDANYASQENFNNYFRGVLIEALGNDGTLMTLALSDATFTIYYTNEILTDETTVDLNGDGDTDDDGILVKTKQIKAFFLSGVRSNVYTRDYSSAVVNDKLLNPDITNGEEKLYVQGAAGSVAEIELFKGIDLEEIRSQNWLINGAILDVYIDESSNDVIPEQLYMYNIDNNTQILDAVSEQPSGGVGGLLVRDEDDDNKPVKYQFSITDYISEIVKPGSTKNISKLAIKTYQTSDDPTTTIDTIMRDFSWFPRGVVLKGNKLPLTDDTRIKLKIYYTVDN
tara:strand:- start:4420 stop:5985 length:1566 start_codon:yes stop_codon:yes gene_type:complete